MKALNLGSGTAIFASEAGWLNLDKHHAPGVDVVADIEKGLWMLKENSFSLVWADNVLEHIDNLDKAIREIHRILKPGGILMARVPYGVSSLCDPYHRRAFDKRTFYAFTPRLGEPCLEAEPDGLFELARLKITRGPPNRWEPPLGWHLKKYMPGVYAALTNRGLNWHVGFRRYLTVSLVKRPNDDTDAGTGPQR